MKEVWLDVPAYAGLYRVSNLGRVKRLISGEDRILAGCIRNTGYKYVVLTDKERIWQAAVHRLVLTTFNPVARMDGLHARHLDGNKLNNSLENLAWGTPADNIADQFRHGTFFKGPARAELTRGSKAPTAKLTDAEVVEIRKILGANILTQRRIAALYGVDPSTIKVIAQGKTWTHLPG